MAKKRKQTKSAAVNIIPEEYVEEKEPRAAAAGKNAFRENLEAILIAVVLAMVIRTFVVQAFKIPSGSMKETLLIGDHILVNKFVYGVRLPYLKTVLIPWKTPERGDIVVFKYPEDPKKDYIKRVIGTPGDVLEIRDKRVYINGVVLHDEAYAERKEETILDANLSHRDNFGPIRVPENALFVMGDNRDFSHDSRFWGFVEIEEIKGKAFMIYFSWNGEQGGVRWKRIAQMLK